MIKMQSNFLLISISISFVGLISTSAINGESSRARAIQIAFPTDHTFHFELDELKSILLADNIKDRQVVIVAVAGTFRKGKSFLLNFFLRYLYARYEKHDVSDWISERNSTELRGFHWKGGRTPVTKGILMWSDIFTNDYENGDKVAIILLDTQGTFDSRSTLLESTTVFALSTLLSSVQCFNVMQNIQEDDLQHLQLYVDYARLALEQSDAKPFQNLLFIVRDWPNQYEVDYGWNGQQVLDEVLAEHPTYQTIEMLQLRRQIQLSFANISAFLMPYPGRIVATGQFTGNVEEFDSDFKKYLQMLVGSLFDPENLVVKEINGQKIRAHQLVQYIEQYTNLFNGETLPEPKTVLQATAEVSNMILCNSSLYDYSNSMGKIITNGIEFPIYYNPSRMMEIHLKAKENVIQKFQSERKLGSKELISSFERKLIDQIDSKLIDFQAINERNRLEQAKLFNEKTADEIEELFYERMVEHAKGVSDYDLKYIFTETKLEALRKFDALKRGDDLGGDKSLNRWKEKLEQSLNKFWPILNRININEREANDRTNKIIEEQNTNLKRVGKTGGGALAGAGLGAMVGGPVGAALGLVLGGLFGYSV